jgi:hypothetical protein
VNKTEAGAKAPAERKDIMTVKAKQTSKNAYDQVLFIAGKQYEAEEKGNFILVLNELHLETPVRLTNLEKNFERC